MAPGRRAQYGFVVFDTTINENPAFGDARSAEVTEGWRLCLFRRAVGAA
jgi:hypothetical protein